MARITYGALVTDIAGSIGGSTFQRNFSGATARSKPQQKFFPSTLQSGSRSDFANIATSWSSLSLTVQQDWNAYAALHPITDRWGNIRTLSGFQYYMQSNLNLLTLGLVLLASPPTYVAPDIVPDYTVVGFSNSLHLNFYPAINFPDSELVVYATAPTTSSKLTNRKNLLLIGSFPAPNAGIFDITAMYSSSFGLTWADFFNSAQCNIIIQLMLVNSVTGVASPFNGYVFPIRNYPEPDWSTFGASFSVVQSVAGQSRIVGISSVPNGKILVSSYADGLILDSNDNGLSFNTLSTLTGVTTANVLLMEESGLVIAGCTSGRIFRSTDFGATWSDLGTMYTQTEIISMVKVTSSIFVAGTFRSSAGGLILRSIDAGVTWSNLGNLGGATSVVSMIYLEAGIILAGVNVVGKLFKSTDQGATWSDLGQIGGSSNVQSLLYCGNGIVLAVIVATTSFIYKSVDYGASWSQVYSFGVVSAVRGFAYLGNGIAALVSVSSGKLFRSIDYGDNWSDLGVMSADTSMFSLAKVRSNVVIAGSAQTAIILRSSS